MYITLATHSSATKCLVEHMLQDVTEGRA